jgi:hypothetical protein
MPVDDLLRRHSKEFGHVVEVRTKVSAIVDWNVDESSFGYRTFAETVEQALEQSNHVCGFDEMRIET